MLRRRKGMEFLLFGMVVLFATAASERSSIVYDIGGYEAMMSIFVIGTMLNLAMRNGNQVSAN